MNLKTVYATLAAFVVSFLLGWLVYGVLLMGFYEANTIHYEGLYNSEPNMLYMIISQLAWCFMIVIVLQLWVGNPTAGRGAGLGLTLSVLMSIGYDFYIMADMNLFNWTVVMVDILMSAVFGAIIGAVAGWVLGAGSKKAAEAA